MSTNLVEEHIAAKVRVLPAELKREVLDFVEFLEHRAATATEPRAEGKESTPVMSEDDFESYLAAKGVIAPIEKADESTYDFHNYKPITVGGKPLSEMIIEERR